MKERPNILLVIASGGMMLSWFYAWDSFIMLSISRDPIPVSEAAFVLIMACLITAIHQLRGWRWIFIVLLHLMGFSIALSMIIYNYNDFSFSFWNLEWISVFFKIEKGVIEWLLFILIIFLTSFLWFYGIRLAITSTNKFCINIRFDIGMASFLVLLLIKLLMRYKGFIPSYNHSSTIHFISFLILGLFSMGLVRNKISAQGGHISYYRGIGVILSFILLVTIFGGGLVMLFLPGMTSGAEIGYDILKTTTRPVGQIIVVILRFIFMRGCKASSQDSSASDLYGIDLSAQAPGDIGLFELILFWSMTIIIAIAGLIGTLMLARMFFRWFFRWLLSRTLEGEEKQDLWYLILQFFAAIKRAILFIFFKMFNITTGDKKGDYFYRCLLGWGSRSGLPHASVETPKEYGSRLANYFPSSAEEIELIVDMFNRSVYGGITPSDHQFSHAVLSWKKLRSPLLWPSRIKSLLFSPGV